MRRLFMLVSVESLPFLVLQDILHREGCAQPIKQAQGKREKDSADTLLHSNENGAEVHMLALQYRLKREKNTRWVQNEGCFPKTSFREPLGGKPSTGF